VGARAPVEVGQLAGDLLVAARQGRDLEQQRVELRIVLASTKSSAVRTSASAASSMSMRMSQSRRTTSTSSRSLVPK
jgi:hypothetical protein